MEKDYKVTLEFDESLKIESERILEGVVLTKEEIEKSNDISFCPKKLENILDKLHLTTQNEKLEFFKKIFYGRDVQNIYKIKLVYFKLQADIEKMEKLKTRIDKRAAKRAKYLLMTLCLILTVQTMFFYHMIYNVEHLGWDLVEPTTYLIQSIILLLGVMAYTKFHRNYMTGSKLIEDSTHNIILKGYAKNNFNDKIYSQLKKESLLLKKYLDK